MSSLYYVKKLVLIIVWKQDLKLWCLIDGYSIVNTVVLCKDIIWHEAWKQMVLMVLVYVSCGLCKISRTVDWSVNISLGFIKKKIKKKSVLDGELRKEWMHMNWSEVFICKSEQPFLTFVFQVQFRRLWIELICINSGGFCWVCVQQEECFGLWGLPKT